MEGVNHGQKKKRSETVGEKGRGISATWSELDKKEGEGDKGEVVEEEERKRRYTNFVLPSRHLLLLLNTCDMS